MKPTIEELRKVYAEAVGAFEAANLGASGIDAGLAAVARFVAERQRAEISKIDAHRIAREANKHNDNDWFSEAEEIALNAVNTALSEAAVAPLVVPEE